jgi:hypothetical protein
MENEACGHKSELCDTEVNRRQCPEVHTEELENLGLEIVPKHQL